MTALKRWIVCAMMVAMFVLLWAGCGSGNEPTVNKTTVYEPTVNEQATEETAIEEAVMQALPFIDDYTEDMFFYQNPSDVNQIGDPYAIRSSDGFYYVYCTSAPNGFYCWRSSDLANWENKRMAYVREQDSWGMDFFWAPEVVEYAGVYYMYYSARDKNESHRIGVAVSDTPDGPFTDALEGPLFDFGYAVIDAHVFIDDDDQKYLYYARDCSENIQNGTSKSEIYGIRLGDDMLSVEGEPVLLLTPEQRWEKISPNPQWNEGPEMIKHNGVYYLTYSANYFEDAAYSVGYATSDAPLGSYTKYPNNPALMRGVLPYVSGPGHHSFVPSPDGTETWIIYHSHTSLIARSGNRQINSDRVIFTDTDELFVNGPTGGLQPLPSGLGNRNLALAAEIKANGQSAPLLNDGIFTLHKRDSHYEWTGTSDHGGSVEITMDWPDLKNIHTILIYNGTDGNDFSEVEINIDGQWQGTRQVDARSEKENYVIIHFETIPAQQITLRLTPLSGHDTVTLSEIMVLCDE